MKSSRRDLRRRAGASLTLFGLLCASSAPGYSVGREAQPAAAEAAMTTEGAWALNQAGGDLIQAGMVKAFLVSAEYRRRFGQN